MSQHENEIRVLPCEVGSYRCCVDMALLTRIERTDRFQSSPALDGPLGWNLAESAAEGKDIPIHSLGVLLGGERPQPGSGGRILITENGAAVWGLAVDRVRALVDVEPSDILPLPSVIGTQARHLFSGVARIGDELWPLLAPEVLKQDPAEQVETLAVESESRDLAITGVDLAPGGELGLAAELEEDSAASAAADGSGAIPVPSDAVDTPSDAADTPSTQGRRGLFFDTWNARVSIPATVYALSMAQVLEVTDCPSLCAIPNAPGFVRGLAAWRDRAIAVLDLDVYVGLADQQGGDEDRLVVARIQGGRVVGLAATNALRGVSLPIEHRPLPGQSPVDRGRTLGVFEHRGATLVVPDLTQLESVVA